jgi:cell division protein ZapB
LTAYGQLSIVQAIPCFIGFVCLQNTVMNDDQLNTLDEKIDALIALCAAMKQENQILRASQHNWQSERQQLLENNRQAKVRLESVLSRLRAMEQSQSA